MSARNCGPCSACCTAFKIDELSKPERTPCSRLAVLPDLGCGDYVNRPEVCQKFTCLWLNDPGALRDEERPDLTRIVLNVANSPFMKETGIVTLVATEVVEGAADTYWAAKVLKRLAKKCLIIVRRSETSRRVMGPPAAMRACMETKARIEQAAAEAKKAQPT